MTFKPLLLLLGLACAPAASAAPKSYTLSSPDGELQRLRHGRIRPPHLAGGRRTNRAGPVARVHDARRRRNAGTRSPGRPHPEALGGRDDRIPVLHQGARQRPLQRTDDLVPRRLQPRAPPLRRRHGPTGSSPKRRERSSSNASRRTSPSPKITRPAHPTSTASSSRISNGSSPTRSRTPTSGSR